jgi:hypothetical protein
MQESGVRITISEIGTKLRSIRYYIFITVHLCKAPHEQKAKSIFLSHNHHRGEGESAMVYGVLRTCKERHQKDGG